MIGRLSEGLSGRPCLICRGPASHFQFRPPEDVSGWRWLCLCWRCAGDVQVGLANYQRQLTRHLTEECTTPPPEPGR